MCPDHELAFVVSGGAKKKNKSRVAIKINCNIYIHKIYVLINTNHKIDHQKIKLHTLKI